MPALGPRALIDNALPLGVDSYEVMRFEMRDGMTPEEVLALAATAIGEENQALEQSYGGLVTFTERLYKRLRVGEGERTMTPTASEFSDPDGVRGDRIGHMFRIEPYKDATEWSTEYLLEAFRDDLRDDVLLIRERWRNRVDYDVVNRLLRSDEFRIGGSGWSPGWAVGSGTNLNFIPPQWMSYIFDDSHSHYIRINSAMSSANLATALERGARELSHHGHTGEKIAYLSEADLSAVNGLNDKKFARFIPANFRITGGSTNAPIATLPGALEGMPGETLGWYSSDYGMVEIKYHPRFPAGYLWLGKSYGVNSALNPLAIRTDPLFGGFGLLLDPQIDRSLNPKLEKILFKARHGVNVNERTNGVAIQIAAGADTYSNPEIV